MSSDDLVSFSSEEAYLRSFGKQVSNVLTTSADLSVITT